MRPVVGSQIIREYIYGFVAVSPAHGKSASLVLPWVDHQTMTVFLKHTSEVFDQDFCLMFLDQASWHQAHELKIPSNIKLLPLPPYSPELNPAEHIWEHLRENFFGNEVFASLDAVAQRLFEGLRSLVLNPEITQSLTCFDWFNTLCLTSN